MPAATAPGANKAERSNAISTIRSKWRESLPLDPDAWREAARKLGVSVKPILDFLRALDEKKGQGSNGGAGAI